MDKYEIKQLLSQDINNINKIIQDLRSEYGLNHDYIHIYMNLLNVYISTNGKDIVLFDNEIRYIFANIQQIAKDNIYINDLLYSYSYFDFFVSESFLCYLDGLSIDDIDHILLVRLINRYFYEYSRSIVLKNHKEFFKKIIEYIYKLPILQNLEDNYNFIFTFENLVGRLGYSLSEYYVIFFVLFEKGMVGGYGSAKESGMINNIDEQDFINILNNQNLLTKIKIINHLHNSIDFKSLSNLSSFDKNILFYLSLIDTTKYFDSNDDKNFLTFCEDFYNTNFESKLKSTNDIQDIDKLIKFLNIYMYDKFFDDKFLKFFLNRIFEGHKYRYYINDFVAKYRYALASRIDIVFPILSDIYTDSLQKENIYDMTIDILLEYTKNFLPTYILHHYTKINNFINNHNNKKYVIQDIYKNLFANIYVTNNTSYQKGDIYIGNILTKLNDANLGLPMRSNLELYKHIKSESNVKTMYLLQRNKKYMNKWGYGNEQVISLNGWFGRNSWLLVRFYHWIMLKLDK